MYRSLYGFLTVQFQGKSIWKKTVLFNQNPWQCVCITVHQPCDCWFFLQHLMFFKYFLFQLPGNWVHTSLFRKIKLKKILYFKYTSFYFKENYRFAFSVFIGSQAQNRQWRSMNAKFCMIRYVNQLKFFSKRSQSQTCDMTVWLTCNWAYGKHVIEVSHWIRFAL